MKGDDVDDGFDVQTFASASGYGDAIETLQGNAVEGSATYTGGAAGKWAIASTTENSTEGGHFTATATIGVDFDVNNAEADADPNDDGVTISGMITDFMTGDTSRPNWRVNLIADNNDDDDDDLAPLGALAAVLDANTRTTWSTGGAVDGTGTWEAAFHGAQDDTMHPMAVTGTFNAAIAGGDVGRIQGAFGAALDE